MFIQYDDYEITMLITHLSCLEIPINFFLKKFLSFRNIIKVPNSLDPGQDQHSVGLDLGPNGLKRFSGKS